MLSRRILAVSAFLAFVCGVMVFYFGDRRFFLPMIILLLIAMITYISQYHINWWWYKKYPPKLPSEIEAFFEKSAPIYRNLSAEDREKFGMRVRLFVESKEFIGKGIEEIPEDVLYMIAYYAILLTFDQEDFLFDRYERIVIYPHPFLSPNIPDDVHSVEIEHSDGTIIFSLEQLAAGFLNPAKYYPVGAHAFAEILTRQKSDEQKSDDAWAEIEQKLGLSRTAIENFIGLKQESTAATLQVARSLT